jgi:hypothetical protein
MSEQGVDLSQIRGDWKFHIDYLTNAINWTMKRQMELWGQLSASASQPGIEQAVAKQKAIWDALVANANDKGTIPTADAGILDFIANCREAKPLCDAFEDSDDSQPVEEFAEACRQTRALCDDLEMMRGQRPDDQ